jgi:hypothetical protein
MNDYVNTFRDNCGIPNRAFYLVAKRLGGRAGENAGRISYNALMSLQVRPNTGFRRLARVTADVAPGPTRRARGLGGLAAVGIRLHGEKVRAGRRPLSSRACWPGKQATPPDRELDGHAASSNLGAKNWRGWSGRRMY